MPGFMALLAALVLVDVGSRAPAQPGTGPAWATMLIAAAVLAVGGECAGRLVRAWSRRQGATIGLRRVLIGWDLCAQTVVVAAFGWMCLEQGWAAWAGSYVLAILPWVGLMGVHWLVLAGGLRAIGDAWCRAGFAWQQFSLGILPMLLILPLVDAGDWVVRTMEWGHVFAGPYGWLLRLAGGIAAAAALVLLAPGLLIRLWGAKPLPAGPGRDLVEDCCRRTGIRVASVLAWPTPGGRTYNAAALGLLPWWRWVLVTEDLLRDFRPEQVSAVIGHELGHVRHRHLLLYLVVLGCLVQVSLLVAPHLVGAGLLPFLPELEATAIVLVLLTLVGIRFGFGPVSRACERQADLAGAACAGRGDVAAGAPVMADALSSVAMLSGQPENAPSWRHRSIADRVAYLHAVARRPALAADHHRGVRRMRLLIICLFIGLGLSLLVQMWTHPLRGVLTAEDPGTALQAEVQARPELGPAFAAADAGDQAPLIAVLRQAPVESVQRVALCLVRIGTEGSTALGVPANDTRAMYAYRHRLKAFARVVTGEPGLDRILDNLTAYVVVAGTEVPTAEDLAVARETLPRLEAAVQKPGPGDHAVWDTIGCVHARLGDWRAARNAFAQALSRMEAEGDSTVAALVGDLYRRRLAAADLAQAQGTARLPMEWDAA
ncbi:MAG: hypothetical protein RLZZ127_3154, partial [Planctomycetota bacterium]